jgi:hypothetical protein
MTAQLHVERHAILEGERIENMLTLIDHEPAVSRPVVAGLTATGEQEDAGIDQESLK